MYSTVPFDDDADHAVPKSPYELVSGSPSACAAPQLPELYSLLASTTDVAYWSRYVSSGASMVRVTDPPLAVVRLSAMPEPSYRSKVNESPSGSVPVRVMSTAASSSVVTLCASAVGPSLVAVMTT